MSSPAASHAHPREHEVRLLVDMVRLSRVTLLIAEPGSEKSDFLHSGVMPLLSRATAGGEAEIAIRFDAWGRSPLPALLERIREVVGARAAVPQAAQGSHSLAASLGAWQEALGVRFLIIFDRFEEYLRAPSGRVGYAEFEDDLVQVAKDPALRANFLLALDEEAEPLLVRLRERIPRLGYSRVRLPRAVHPRATQASERAAPAPSAEPALSMRITPIAHDAEPHGAQKHADPAAKAHHDHAPAPSAAEPPIPADPKAAEGDAGARSLRRPTSIERALAAPPPSHLHDRARPSSPGEQHASKGAVKPASREPVPSPAMMPPESRSPLPSTRSFTETPAAPSPAPASFREQTPPAPSKPVPSPAQTPASPARHTVSPGKILAALSPEIASTGKALPSPSRQAPKRGWARFAWAPIALCAAALLVFWQQKPRPSPEEAVQAEAEARVTPSGRDRAEDSTQNAAAPAPKVSIAAVDRQPPIPASQSAPQASAGTLSTVQPVPQPGIAAPQAPSALASPPGVTAPPEERLRQSDAAVTKTVPTAKGLSPSGGAAPAARPPDKAVSKPALADASPPVAPAPPGPSTRKVEPAPKSATIAPIPPVAAAAPVQRGLQPDIVARAPPAAPVASAAADASGPSLYIHVRNESQRAWAEQVVRPLADRGIRVAGIRVVPSGPEQPDIRYYRLNERSEAMRVAIALREFGLSAQHLKQMEEPESQAPSRQYEVWLPASGYDPRP